MDITIQPRKWIHYLLIYFMIVASQSRLFAYFISDYNIFIVLWILTIMMINKKYRDLGSVIFLLFLLLSCSITRYTVGGAGLGVWLSWAVMILITILAIQYNSDKFMERYVKTIAFLALLSIVGFILQLTIPSLLKAILLEYRTEFLFKEWSSSTNYIATPYNAYGLFLFSMREGEMMRNTSIFTEPGIYQMVLNSAIFIILFFKEKINLQNKVIFRYLVILILALLTCQSTTGYFGFTAIILVFFICKQKNNSNLKYKFIGIVIMFILLLMIDYGIRGSSSFLSTTIFAKLLNQNGLVDFNANTGLYRMGTIGISLQSMLENPFGIGYDNISRLLNAESTGFVAAKILLTGAALGVIPFVIILIWIFTPVFNTKISTLVKILYIFIYFNTALAQSNEFYSALIVIPIFLHLANRKISKTN